MKNNSEKLAFPIKNLEAQRLAVLEESKVSSKENSDIFSKKVSIMIPVDSFERRLLRTLNQY